MLTPRVSDADLALLEQATAGEQLTWLERTARNLRLDLLEARKALSLQIGVTRADDERLHNAAVKVWGENVHGCDAADWMADELLDERAAYRELAAMVLRVNPEGAYVDPLVAARDLAATFATQAEELAACTTRPGGCGYWREAARRREAERTTLAADLERATTALLAAAADFKRLAELPGRGVVERQDLAALATHYTQSAESLAAAPRLGGEDPAGTSGPSAAP